MQYWNPTYAKTNQHCRADDCLASIWTAVSAFSLVVPVAEMFYIVFSHLWTCLWQINDDDDDDLRRVRKIWRKSMNHKWRNQILKKCRFLDTGTYSKRPFNNHCYVDVIVTSYSSRTVLRHTEEVRSWTVSAYACRPSLARCSGASKVQTRDDGV